MAVNKPKKPTKKVIDVKAPEEVKANASSRPIIVNNRPLAQDPMMASDTSETASAPPLVGHHERKIMPLSENDKEDSNEADAANGESGPTASELVSKLEARNAKSKAVLGGRVSDDKVDEKAEASEAQSSSTSEASGAEDASQADDNADDKKTDTSAAETKTEPTEEKAGDGASDSTDSSSDESQSSEQKPAEKKSEADNEAELEAEAKRQAELDELVESGKYFVPINQVRKRHDRRLLAALIIILLAIVAVDLLYDSGVLKSSGFTYHTHFFHH